MDHPLRSVPSVTVLGTSSAMPPPLDAEAILTLTVSMRVVVPREWWLLVFRGRFTVCVEIVWVLETVMALA